MDHEAVAAPVSSLEADEWQNLAKLSTVSDQPSGPYDVELNLSALVANHCPSALKDADTIQLPTQLQGTTKRPCVPCQPAH